MNRVAELVHDKKFETLRVAGEFATLARCILQAKGQQSLAVKLAENSSAARVATVLRAAVAAGTLNSLTDYKLLAGAFSAALQNFGLFDACLAGGMRRVPLATSTVGNISVAAIAGISEELGVKVVSRLTIENGILTPIKAAVILALSNELLRVSADDSQQLISRELVNASALAADRKFLTVALSGITAFTSSGSTAVSFRSDLASLLGLIRTDATSRLFLAMPSLVCKTLSVMGATPTNATPAFPELTPQGGSISGIRVVVSDACATGTVTLLDASRFAGASDPVAVELFRQTSINMFDAPDSPPTSSTTMLPLWQLNMSAILAERWIGVQRLNTDSVASVVNANSWVGGFSPP